MYITYLKLCEILSVSCMFMHFFDDNQEEEINETEETKQREEQV